MNSTQAIQFSNIGTGATAPFTLLGGTYTVTWQATLGGGNLQLQILAGDGVSWLNVGAAITTLGLSNIGPLPPGQYRFNITTATANYISLATVPIG